MASSPALFVRDPWPLHEDALVEALASHGLEAGVTDDVDVPGLLLVGVTEPDLPTVLARRRDAGAATVVWGGTLPSPREEALRSVGAAAYVSMLQPPRVLSAVGECVLSGQWVHWVPPAEPMVALTPREHEVAQAYCARWPELARAEVAARLGMSERTLKTHVANIRRKAGHRGTETRVGLCRALTVNGWLEG